MEDSRPIIYYIDDEPFNLTVFETMVPEEWNTKTFADPLKALEELMEDKPWVVLSDQKMPGTSGVKFLEMVKNLTPNAIRIIVTGFSDENLVVDSVRKACIYDYIKKPWNEDDFLASLNRAIDHHKKVEETKRLQAELAAKNRELEEKAIALKKLVQQERNIRNELSHWVPPFVLEIIDNGGKPENKRHDLYCLTFDVINSSVMHETMVGNKTLRTLTIETFTDIVLKHGGWRESHAGDSAYAHFGLVKSLQHHNYADAALAAAREFRVALRSITSISKCEVEVGIGLHLAENCDFSIHKTTRIVSDNQIVQKSFDTTSIDIDIVHKIEKLVHTLPGTNIIMTGDFVSALSYDPQNTHDLGDVSFSSKYPIKRLFLIKSDFVSENALKTFKSELAFIHNENITEDECLPKAVDYS